jgi:hypothetical protein
MLFAGLSFTCFALIPNGGKIGQHRVCLISPPDLQGILKLVTKSDRLHNNAAYAKCAAGLPYTPTQYIGPTVITSDQLSSSAISTKKVSH